MEKTIRRIQWVDAARALAMLFVIFGHQVKTWKNYFVYTSPIKIPLFFAVTGYVFNDRRMDTKAFFKNLLRRIIIPWMCLTMPFYVWRARKEGPMIILTGFYNLISGKSMWYMSCFVIAEIIWFLIMKAASGCRRKTLAVSVLAIAVWILGLICAKRKILGFAMANRAMIAQLFILEGYLFRVFERKTARLRAWQVGAAAAFYIAMGYISTVVWPRRNMDVHINKYYNIPFCFALILVGCFAVMLVLSHLPRHSRILCFIGQNTLVYYMLNGRAIAWFKKFLAAAGITISPWYVFAVSKTVAACIICGIIAIVLNRYLPEAVGRKRKRRLSES